MENVARLLVLCGNSLCYTFLASKAVNGRLLEISRLIVYIILVRKIRLKRLKLRTFPLLFFTYTIFVSAQTFFRNVFVVVF